MSSSPKLEDRRLFGGADVHDADGDPVGVVGLLVEHAISRRVFAISDARMVVGGNGPIVGLAGSTFVLGSNDAEAPPPPILQAASAPSIAALVGIFPVPAEIHVSSTVVSLEDLGEVKAALPGFRAAGAVLRLVVGRSYTEWRITTVATYVSFEGPDGKDVGFVDAIICSPCNIGVELDGLCGAVFFTVEGHPVGMLVGALEGKAIVAPLRAVLWRAGLSPLTDRTAAIHNGELTVPLELHPIASTLSSAERELILDREGPDTVALPFGRPRSYRFALLPLRSSPAISEITGFEALKKLLPVSQGRSGASSNRKELREWLMASVRRHAAATSVEEMATAFTPLVLQQPDRPAREVHAALAALDEFKPVQAVAVASRYLRSEVVRRDVCLRTTLWWLAQEFLIRRPHNEVPFDVAEALHRALSVRFELAAEDLKSRPADAGIELEVFAMLETAMALPLPLPRDGLANTAMLKLRSSTTWSPFIAARSVFQAIRDSHQTDLRQVVSKHSEFIAEVRAYEATIAKADPEFTSRFDQRLTYLLGHVGAAEETIEQVFIEMRRIGPGHAHAASPGPEFFAMQARQTRELFKRLVKEPA